MSELDPKLSRAVNMIQGVVIESRIKQLASISSEGRIGRGGSRLGLSSAEPEARALLGGWMRSAGMGVREYPLGLVGRYKGKNNRKAPIAFGSHFDTVPASGEYDGPAGTIAAIAVIEAFNEVGLRLSRPLNGYAFTLEESSRYNQALLGSRSMTHGLSLEQLLLIDSNGVTLAQAIESMGFDPELTRNPSPKKPKAFLEMHIEQAPTLADRAIDIGVVEAIAATSRQQVLIGSGNLPKVALNGYTEGVKLTVNGQAGHSGGTPMGNAHRADGLIPTAHFLEAASEVYNRNSSDIDLHILGVNIEGQALNKIPGTTTTTVLVSGKDSDRVTDIRQSLVGTLSNINSQYAKTHRKFGGRPIDIETISEGAAADVYEPRLNVPLFRTAAGIILAVERIVSQDSLSRTVGTVGTFRQLPDGILELGVDIRGVNRAARSQALNRINNLGSDYAYEDQTLLSLKELTSVENASHMNPEITSLVEESARALGLTTNRMPSGPGHDAQNFVERHVPTGMLFIPSRNGGLSHNPLEYSTPQDLENGARVLALTVAALASS